METENGKHPQLAQLVGWVKFYRKALASEQSADPVEWRLLTGCLLLANHRPVDVKLRTGEVVHLEPGQFLTSRLRLFRTLFGTPAWQAVRGVSERAVWATLERIATAQQTAQETTQQTARWLTLETTQHYSVITILNWERYQSGGDANSPADVLANSPADSPANSPANSHEQELRSHGTHGIHGNHEGHGEGDHSCSMNNHESMLHGRARERDHVTLETATRPESIALAEHCRALGAELPAWWARQLDWAFANGVTLAEAKFVVKRHPDLVLDPKKLCAELIRQHRDARFDRSAKYVEYNADGSVKKDWM